MKRTQWTIAIALALVIALPALTAQNHTILYVPATTSVNGALQITIPFDFSVGDKLLKSGEYVIAPSGDKALTFKSTGGNGSAVTLTNAVISDKGDGPRLVFHRYAGQYFLTQAWLSHSGQGRELFVSAKEIQMAREYSQEQVILMAKK